MTTYAANTDRFGGIPGELAELCDTLQADWIANHEVFETLNMSAGKVVMYKPYMPIIIQCDDHFVAVCVTYEQPLNASPVVRIALYESLVGRLTDPAVQFWTRWCVDLFAATKQILDAGQRDFKLTWHLHGTMFQTTQYPNPHPALSGGCGYLAALYWAYIHSGGGVDFLTVPYNGGEMVLQMRNWLINRPTDILEIPAPKTSTNTKR